MVTLYIIDGSYKSEKSGPRQAFFKTNQLLESQSVRISCHKVRRETNKQTNSHKDNNNNHM